MNDVAELEHTLGVTFRNRDLITQALVHRSFLNENPSFHVGHNERLEFLGDAVLEVIVTEELFHAYPQAPEGDLTNWRASLVNSKMLSELASSLGVEAHLYLSRGEARDTSQKARQYILANAMEAIVGAMYLDGGMEVPSKFIRTHLMPRFQKILDDKLWLDPKSAFQEKAQEEVSVTPSYRVLSEKGPDHSKEFTVGVYLNRDLVAKGSGSSKQEAQVDAAAKALKEKGWG